MSSQHLRAFSLVALFAASAVTIAAGLNGWVLLKGAAEIPMHFLGFALGGAALLGICGVNIWIGGPLDPQKDAV